MEHGPRPLQEAAEDPDGDAAVHQRDQDEDHLASIEVAEQPQTQGHRLRDQRNAFEYQVDRGQVPGKRVAEEFLQEPADSLLLDAEEDDQHEHRERHAQGDVGIRRRDDLHVVDANELRGFGDPVHGYQIHQVLQEHPDEDRERHGRDQAVGVLEDARRRLVDEVDDHLDGVLQSAGDAGRRPTGRDPEHHAEQDPERRRPEQGVDVERPEAHLGGLLGALREPPGAVCLLAERQVRQVVLDVLAGAVGHRIPASVIVAA